MPANIDKEERELPGSCADNRTEKLRSQGWEKPMRAMKKAEAKEAQSPPAPRQTAVTGSITEGVTG